MRVRWLLGIGDSLESPPCAACSATEDDLSPEEAAVAAGFDKNNLMLAGFALCTVSLLAARRRRTRR
jgi:hypothetical protein